MIETKDISIIVQGAIDDAITEKCLQSLRKYMPDADIILSTYKNSNVDNLSFDKLIFSDDPGFFLYDSNHKKPNNVNRQIVTTLAGLKAATKKYALKIRTDFILKGDRFLDFWDKFSGYEKEYRIFEQKLLACCYFSRNPDERDTWLFHPSDIAFFGLTIDLVKLFDIPLMEKDEAQFIEIDGIVLAKYVPEQHIFINCLKKSGKNINFCFQKHINAKNRQDTERYFASNFLFLNWEQFNLVPPEKFYEPDFARLVNYKNTVTHIEWQKMYKKHIDPALDIPDEDIERVKINQIYEYKKTLKLIANFVCLFIWKKQLRHKTRWKILDYLSQK